MLPPEERETLLSLLNLNPLRAKQRISALRKRGWTVREIASAVDRAPSTIQYWSQYDLPENVSDVPYPDPRRKIPGTAVRRRAVELHAGQVAELQELTQMARRRNRHSQQGSREYAASTQLTALLTHLWRDRLVPVTTLAKAADISPSAVSQRIKDQTDVVY